MNKRQRKKHGGAKLRRRFARGVQVEESSGNVFADLGLPNPEERLAEAERQLAEERAGRMRARRTEPRIERLRRRRG